MRLGCRMDWIPKNIIAARAIEALIEQEKIAENVDLCLGEAVALGACQHLVERFVSVHTDEPQILVTDLERVEYVRESGVEELHFTPQVVAHEVRQFVQQRNLRQINCV